MDQDNCSHRYIVKILGRIWYNFGYRLFKFLVQY